MALHFGIKNDSESDRKKVVGKIRRTQLITTFGSGAIVDMPDYSVIMASISDWKTRSPILHEPNLERLLGVRMFKQPYASEDQDNEFTADVPAFQFPTMYFCPECHRLMPYWGFGSDKHNRKCSKCNKTIIPSRFLAGCINGHLEDFPYKWWVHYGNFSDCPAADKNDKLKITISDETGGLDSILITCTACGKTRSMAGSLDREALKGYHCRGRRPWIGARSEHNDPVECHAPMRGLQRGASNVYFALNASALTIPPWSTKLRREIEMRYDGLKAFFDAAATGALNEDTIRNFIRSLFDEVIQRKTYTLDQILTEVKSIFSDKGTSDQYNQDYTKKNLLEDEYRVFCLRDYERPDDIQFHIESTEVTSFFDGLIDDVILVKRLREVLALYGFRRITPEEPLDGEEKFKGYNLESNYVPLGENDEDWLPAIEMLGEGIFIRLNESALNKWERDNTEIYGKMAKRLSDSTVKCENFSTRYVLLHTLAHLLIRELSIECGYSGASIKERIYSSYHDSGIPMAGILLYTSSSDSDGSLGGLVRNGEPETFERIFRNMLQNASWCSSDPICMTSHAQGYYSLNYAACHACTLLPETSCEMRNCLLDRCAVVGSVENRARGFFGVLIN